MAFLQICVIFQQQTLRVYLSQASESCSLKSELGCMGARLWAGYFGGALFKSLNELMNKNE